MSEFETLADLFPEDRQPTRELEPIQKVDRTDQIERDIEEFHETESAKRMLDEAAEIVDGAGLAHRFRYVHATFGSGKSHLLKLIGVATGEMEGLEDYAHQLANTRSGFKQFRDALSESRIDHLQPLFMNLLDRDQDDRKLPLMLFEELGRRRDYYTSRTWLLEFCWRLDIEYSLWDQLVEHEHQSLQLRAVVNRPSSLRPWLMKSLPQLEGAEEAGLDTEQAVKEEIEAAAAAVEPGSFGPDELVDRLDRTKRHLEQGGEVYEFLIGLDEIAIYVGDQPARYEEVVNTITTLIESIKPPILGTGQWSMRDMQQEFVGEVNDDAWYTKEIKLQGADTETIVRKRWLQKSDSGRKFIEDELLDTTSEVEPILGEDADPPRLRDPVEAYPFRDQDLRLLRATMQGLIKGERETDREYIQGRALLVRVRSLFADHNWAEREPGASISWDVHFDILESDTALVPSWATDLIERAGNTIDEPLAKRSAKALFLLSQVETVPRTATNIARLLADDVTVDVEQLTEEVDEQLQNLADANLIREDVEASPTTYTILSEKDIQFWQEVQQEATEMPEHQLRDNLLQFVQEADSDRLTAPGSTATATFDNTDDVAYTIRYSVDRPIPESVSDKHDAIVVRLLANEQEVVREQRERWQDENGGPGGREDVLVTVELTEAIRQQVRQLIGMQSVLGGMADPRPEYRLQRQTLQEEIEDTIKARLNVAQVYTSTRGSSYGSYIASVDEVVDEAVREKFPNRKNIERPLQRDDLQALFDFFGDDGPWPFTDTDAEELGVNTVPRTIDNGWATEFLEEFSDEDRVSGERVLETIEGRRGTFLGTPPEALQALLFILVVDNRIEVRSDGERVDDTYTIATIITRRSRFEDAVVGFDPEPPADGLDEIYEALLDESPDTDDTKALLENITDWADANGSYIRTVISRTNLEFDNKYTLEDLKTALEPAFSGDDPDANLLTNPTVADQATLYNKISPLFLADEGDEETIWDQFSAMYETINDLYPTASIVKQMQVYAHGSQTPDADSLESQIERAIEYRVEQLQMLHRDLLTEEASTEEIESLRAEITSALTKESVLSDVETIEEHFDSVSFERIPSLVEEANTTSKPLAEPAFADREVQNEAKILARGRAILETEENGASLYDRLFELETALSESHDGFVTTQITRAISGEDIPDLEGAEQLLAQGRNIRRGEEPEDGDDTQLQQLWMEVSEYGDGTIVAIDPEGNR
jgi:hypothetical protein